MSEKISTETANHLNDLIDSDDDESFVILGSSPPLSAVQFPENDTHTTVQQPLTSISVTEASTSTETISAQPSGEYESDIAEVSTNNSLNASIDIMPEEILQKLNYLFEENVNLKDSLNENNMRMKKQYAELVAWQKEVMDVHQLHKTKFDTLKGYIDTLKSENCKLYMALQKETLKSLQSMEESQSSTEDFQLKTEVADLQEKIEIFKRELDKEKKLNRDVINSHNAKSYQLSESYLIEPSKNLQDENLMQCSAMMEEMSLLSVVKNDFQKKAIVMVEGTTNASKNDLDELSVKRKIEAEIIEKDAVINKLQAESKIYKESIQSLLNEKDSIISSLEADNNAIKENMTIQILEKDKEIAHLDYVMGCHISSLSSQNQELSEKVSLLESEKRHLQVKYSELQETITALGDKISYMENSIIKPKNDDIKKLEKTIEELETTVVVLTETSNVYRSDFEAEHNTKEALRSEKDQLINSLKVVQKKNEQLLEQIKSFNGQARASSSSNPEPPSLLQCPTCFEVFSKFSALEKHVNRCIDNDFSFNII